jgi:RNA recognition motif-containing protein
VETPKQVIEEPKPKTSVFVANLPRSVKVNGLIELFKDFEVESALVAIQHK